MQRVGKSTFAGCGELGEKRFWTCRAWGKGRSGMQGVGKRRFGHARRGVEQVCGLRGVGKRKPVLCIAISLVSYPP